MKEIEYSMKHTKANAIGLVITLFIALLYMLFFLLYSVNINGLKEDLIFFKELSITQRTPYMIFTFSVFVFGIILHEAIHGFFFAIFNNNGWKAVKFGFSKKMMAPYAHCKESVKVKHFRIAVLMPLVILGICPFVIYLFVNNLWIFLFSLMFSIAGGGDLIVIWLVRKLEANTMIKDHPTKLGYLLYEK